MKITALLAIVMSSALLLGCGAADEESDPSGVSTSGTATPSQPLVPASAAQAAPQPKPEGLAYTPDEVQAIRERIAAATNQTLDNYAQPGHGGIVVTGNTADAMLLREYGITPMGESLAANARAQGFLVTQKDADRTEIANPFN